MKQDDWKALVLHKQGFLILIENQNYPLLTSTCRTPVQPAPRRLGYF